VDKGGLWFRVLASRYGMERGRLRVERVCVEEGDCKNSRPSVRDWGRMVRGVCFEEGGGHDKYSFLV
jgi:hypothetical protein